MGEKCEHCKHEFDHMENKYCNLCLVHLQANVINLQSDLEGAQKELAELKIGKVAAESTILEMETEFDSFTIVQSEGMGDIHKELMELKDKISREKREAEIGLEKEAPYSGGCDYYLGKLEILEKLLPGPQRKTPPETPSKSKGE